VRDAAYANYERVPNGFAPPPYGGRDANPSRQGRGTRNKRPYP